MQLYTKFTHKHDGTMIIFKLYGNLYGLIGLMLGPSKLTVWKRKMTDGHLYWVLGAFNGISVKALRRAKALMNLLGASPRRH